MVQTMFTFIIPFIFLSTCGGMLRMNLDKILDELSSDIQKAIPTTTTTTTSMVSQAVI